MVWCGKTFCSQPLFEKKSKDVKIHLGKGTASPNVSKVVRRGWSDGTEEFSEPSVLLTDSV